MTNLEILGISVGAFVATNINDLFILLAFFAKRSFPNSQIILGQYVGMGLLLGVSLVWSLVVLVIPHNLLGLVGLFPIAIGIKELLVLRRRDNDADDNDVKVVNKINKGRWKKWRTLTLQVIPICGF